MNERIRNLALQAMDNHGAVDDNTTLQLNGAEIEKFADFIICECINQIDNIYFGGGDDWDRALRLAMNNINQSFGL